MSRGSYNNAWGKPQPKRIARPEPKLDQIRAPYTFVPLSEHVVDSGGGDPRLDPARVSHDVPFSDGIVGSLEVLIEARNPVFIRDAADPKRFFRMADGRMAIPGSSIRGMLRNVVEIASFGRMGHFNDHRYGVRDLHNRALYGQHMADIVEGQPMPLVSAGWLRKRGPDEDDAHEYPAELVPCSFAKIHYERLMQLRKGFEPGRKQSAPDKYKAWGGEHKREVKVEVEWLLDGSKRVPGQPERYGDYGAVRSVGRGEEGTIVFTGQPQNWSPDRAPKRKGAGNPKQHDFVFMHKPLGETILVPRRVWEDFLFVHRDTGQQHRLEDSPNPELKHWLWSTGWYGKEDGQGVPYEGHPEGIPVFFLMERDSDRLRAMGLAMMFRLAYRMSVGEAVANSHKPGKGGRTFDLADLIFGDVPLDPKGDKASEERRCLKGRVAFGHALLPDGAREQKEVRAVLGTPKASYYPNYTEQDPAQPGSPAKRGRDGKPAYKTWMDKDARIRGWKRYPPQQSYQESPKLPDKSSEHVVTTFRPVAWPQHGAARCVMRVHNLRPFELGALLWALDFGGAPNVWHGLGMAKSLGYGVVRLSVGVNRLQTVRGEPVDLEAARAAYVEFMERQLRHRTGDKQGWWPSPQIVALIRAATLGRVEDGELRHMEIAHPTNGNEFQVAKQRGYALPAPFHKAHVNDAAQQPMPMAALREIAPGVVTRPSAAKLPGRPTPPPPSTPPPSPPPVGATLPVIAHTPSGDEALLQDALSRGTQIALLEGWMKDGGPQEKTRRALANRFIPSPSANMRKKYGHVVAWMEGGGAASSGGAASGKPAPPAQSPPTPDEAERIALERAKVKGTHMEMIQQWMDQGGKREAARRAIVRAVLGNPSPKLQAKYPEVVAWMQG